MTLAEFQLRALAIEPQAVAKQAFPSVVLITMKDKDDKPTSLGSGFVVQRDIVATNLHVIRGSSKGSIRLVGQSREVAIAGIVATDEVHDLVLLRVVLDAPTLSLNAAGVPEIGQTVYAVGNPQGLEGTFSQGIVSSVRKIETGSLLQITAPISPGSSGGPILDLSGKVVGIAVATFKDGQNLNFAIPVNALKLLIAHKQDAQRFLGQFGCGIPGACCGMARTFDLLVFLNFAEPEDSACEQEHDQRTKLELL